MYNSHHQWQLMGHNLKQLDLYIQEFHLLSHQKLHYLNNKHLQLHHFQNHRIHLTYRSYMKNLSLLFLMLHLKNQILKYSNHLQLLQQLLFQQILQDLYDLLLLISQLFLLKENKREHLLQQIQKQKELNSIIHLQYLKQFQPKSENQMFYHSSLHYLKDLKDLLLEKMNFHQSQLQYNQLLYHPKKLANQSEIMMDY